MPSTSAYTCPYPSVMSDGLPATAQRTSPVACPGAGPGRRVRDLPPAARHGRRRTPVAAPGGAGFPPTRQPGAARRLEGALWGLPPRPGGGARAAAGAAPPSAVQAGAGLPRRKSVHASPRAWWHCWCAAAAGHLLTALLCMASRDILLRSYTAIAVACMCVVSYRDVWCDRWRL